MKRHKKETINSISVEELTEYLRNKGWFLNHSREDAYFFTHKNYDYEILVPLDYNLGDWTLRISEAISILSECEDRYEIDTIRDIKKETNNVFLEKLQDGDYNLPQITRVDIILDGFRVQYNMTNTTLSIQDEGRTLKVFIDTTISDKSPEYETKKRSNN
jgi:hypothetical protein